MDKRKPEWKLLPLWVVILVTLIIVTFWFSGPEMGVFVVIIGLFVLYDHLYNLLKG